MKKEVIAITGAGGFIGSAVVRRCAGRPIRCLLGPDDPQVTEPNTWQGDIEQPGLVDEVVAGSQVVIHLAGPPSVARSFQEPEEFRRVHLGGTQLVVDACRRHAVRRLVYISSGEVYGQPDAPVVAEDHPLRPRSPYGEAKVEAERQVAASGLDWVILRPFSVYGPRRDKVGVVQIAVETALRERRVALQTFRPVRDFCFVDDVADAIVAAISPEVPRGSICNLGSGEGTSIGELAETVAKVAGDLPIEETGAERPADIEVLIADVTRARKSLGWTASTSLQEGIRRVVHAEGHH